MKLRVGTLAKALGGLLGLFVAFPVVLGYAMNHVPAGTLDLSFGVVALVGAAVLLVRPGWGGSFWGRSALPRLFFGMAFVCLGLEKLHVVPESWSAVVGWAGVVLFGGSLLIHRRRGSATSEGAAP